MKTNYFSKGKYYIKFHIFFYSFKQPLKFNSSQKDQKSSHNNTIDRINPNLINDSLINKTSFSNMNSSPKKS